MSINIGLLDNKMGHKIESLFMENPEKEYHIREIARLLKIPKSTAAFYVSKMCKTGLIAKKEQGVFPSFIANSSSEEYKLYKRHGALKAILDSGILDFLEQELNPRCIVLFGSFAKAEYDLSSDIDIFVQANEKVLGLSRFEKQLKHPINLFFEPDLSKLSPELLNNIINGIKLKGYLKIK
ncbi:MAG: nucleotidyltransferase domain-containing protein [Candidatus Nanoarchaeia archaeon]|nr:nucleotidyltransferase domain-containing protein [Candidatus Nanoarchaeia archaeon]